MFRTVLIFVLTGAILGAVVASFVVPPALTWYNEAGFLSQQQGQVQALVNLPQVIRYATNRLLRGQAIGAGIGAFTFLILGLYSASVSRRRARPAPAASGSPGMPT